MTPKKQKIHSSTEGDCLRACIASILEVTNNYKLPSTHTADWYDDGEQWFRNRGMRLTWSRTRYYREGYWIALVPSRNFKDGTHAIVMQGHKVAHDPSIKKRYRKGTNLLGKGIMRGGYRLEIDDVKKLRNFLNGRY